MYLSVYHRAKIGNQLFFIAFKITTEKGKEQSTNRVEIDTHCQK